MAQKIYIIGGFDSDKEEFRRLFPDFIETVGDHVTDYDIVEIDDWTFIPSDECIIIRFAYHCHFAHPLPLILLRTLSLTGENDFSMEFFSFDALMQIFKAAHVVTHSSQPT